MDIKRMHCMIEKISKCADEQLEHGVEMADTEEMGKVIDMLKDLSEAMYYRTLTTSFTVWNFSKSNILFHANSSFLYSPQILQRNFNPPWGSLVS